MCLYEEFIGGRVYYIYIVLGGVRRDIFGDKWFC